MNGNSQPRNSPYQGLIPYTEKDAVFFFGREKDTRLITANFFASPLTILYGPSGVGKSSALRAGAVHQLSQRTDLTIIYNSDWKEDPLERLKTMLASLPNLVPAPDKNLPFTEFLTECTTRLGHRLMIVLDQFEEYFLYHPEEDEFTIQFSRAVMQTVAPVSFLISIREDGLAKLDRFEGRIPILFDNYLRLEHLDDAAARSAIEKPIEKYNELYLEGKPAIHIEAGLVEEVLKQLKSGQVSLQQTGHGAIEQDASRMIETPYLQLVMERLWNQEIKLQSNLLRLTTLKSLGGAGKIVKTHLDAVMWRLKRSQRLLASRIFQYLVTPSGTKIALRVSDLASYADSSPQKIQPLLQRLTSQDIRLLRAVDTVNKNEMSYEIYHDVLALPILDWRVRYRRSRRIYLLISPILFLVALFIYSYSLSSGAGIELYLAIVALLTCLIPMIFGFLIGRGWARAR